MFLCLAHEADLQIKSCLFLQQAEHLMRLLSKCSEKPVIRTAIQVGKKSLWTCARNVLHCAGCAKSLWTCARNVLHCAGCAKSHTWNTLDGTCDLSSHSHGGSFPAIIATVNSLQLQLWPTSYFQQVHSDILVTLSFMSMLLTPQWKLCPQQIWTCNLNPLIPVGQERKVICYSHTTYIFVML